MFKSNDIFYKDLQKEIDRKIEMIETKKQILMNNRQKATDTQFYNILFYTIYNYAEKYKQKYTYDEAIAKYANLNAITQEKNYIMDMLYYINSEKMFDFQIDKKMFCKLLGIEIETYNWLLSTSNTYASRPVFQDIEEFLISLKQNSAEINSRNANAVDRNLRTDSKFNGHDVISAKNKDDASTKVVINYSDNKEVRKSLAKFDFKALGLDSSNNES